MKIAAGRFTRIWQGGIPARQQAPLVGNTVVGQCLRTQWRLYILFVFVSLSGAWVHCGRAGVVQTTDLET